MRKSLNALKYIAFLGIGIFLFSLLYKEYNLSEFISTILNLKWGWVILSFVFSILSHLSRAIRWNMLITPLGFKPKLTNTFLSVLILYATNLIIPRGGELARCTLLSRYEKIPFGKLVGTVVTERATDTLILFILVITTVFSQFGIFQTFIENNPEFGKNFSFMFSLWFWIILITLIIGILVSIWRLRNTLKKIPLAAKIFELLYNFYMGIKSIKDLKKPGLYIAHSIFIYIMYFLMMYVIFFAFKPTENTGAIAGLTAFIMGGLAMLMPVQGGIGAWHFMVYETLYIYGLDKISGKEFALISHSSMNLFLLLIGGLSFIILPLYNLHLKRKNSI